MQPILRTTVRWRLWLIGWWVFEAWRYRLDNRSALEWVLDQYRERTPKDPTIRAQFDTYRFADHAAHVAELLARVCTVSVQTMKVVDALAAHSPLGNLTPGA